MGEEWGVGAGGMEQKGRRWAHHRGIVIPEAEEGRKKRASSLFSTILVNFTTPLSQASSKIEQWAKVLISLTEPYFSCCLLDAPHTSLERLGHARRTLSSACGSWNVAGSFQEVPGLGNFLGYSS